MADDRSSFVNRARSTRYVLICSGYYLFSYYIFIFTLTLTFTLHSSSFTHDAQGEEVLHLPAIVEAAVASPAAAAMAARKMRIFLSKDNFNRPHVQYNAVMLIRILTDNPGASFTKNLDKPFADTVKNLLRNGPDPSVAQIVMETLDSLERDKAADTNLHILFSMWRKEKGLMEKATMSFGPRTLNAPAWPAAQHTQGGFGTGSGRANALPPPQELAGRIQVEKTPRGVVANSLTNR